ncbi:MAG TPA: zf-HC2 domain-containing protein [Myxococcaceae bacterium]|nr:zf-HC2 domain-containing protein [Myxococcaceae bacterium]
MSSGPHPSAALHDLHDGRLDPAERARVEEHLLSCTRCQSELEALRALSGAARQLAGSAVPGDFEPLLRGALDTEDRHQAGVRRRRLVAASLLVVAAALVLWVLRAPARPDWAAIAVATAEQFERGQLLLDVAETSPDRLEAALRARGASVRVLDLGMMGLQLLGGSVREVEGRRVALIAYRDAQGRTLLCEMLPGAGIRLPRAADQRHQGTLVFHVYALRGRTAVFWHEGPVLCVLVGTGDAEAVVALAMAKAMVPEGAPREGRH